MGAHELTFSNARFSTCGCDWWALGWLAGSKLASKLNYHEGLLYVLVFPFHCVFLPIERGGRILSSCTGAAVNISLYDFHSFNLTISKRIL